MVPGQESLLTKQLSWLARKRATSLQPSHLPCWTQQMTPDHLGLKVEMAIKAPPIYCHLFLALCSLQRYSGSIHADIWNRQDEDHNRHFDLQLNLRTYKYYYYYYGWVTVNSKWGSICHSQSACTTRLSCTCKYVPHQWPMAATTCLRPHMLSGVTSATLSSRRWASSPAEPTLMEISTQRSEVIQCKAKTNVTAIWTGPGAGSWEMPKEHFVLVKCFGTRKTSPGCWTLSVFK